MENIDYREAIVLAASAYLIKLAACYLTQSWPTLAIIAVLITAAMIGFRIWKHHRDQYW